MAMLRLTAAASGEPGTLTWVSSYFELGYNPYGTSIGGGTLDNAAGATFLIESDQNIYANSGTTLFTNEGQLTKSVTTGTTTIEVAFDNTGTVDVETGTLALGGGGTSALSAFTVASPGRDARLRWRARSTSPVGARSAAVARWRSRAVR